MERYRINVEQALGVPVYELRKLAKRLGTDHGLALAVFVDDPAQVTPEQMEAWAANFDSWDVCDQATTSLFDLTPHAWDKAAECARRDEEWVKRAGFALMAGLAVHDKGEPDEAFVELLPLIEGGASTPART